MITENDKTNVVHACKTFAELEAVIRKYEPFMSTSRPEPVYWYAAPLLARIQEVRNGGRLYLVTRANGLREKVMELVLKDKA